MACLLLHCFAEILKSLIIHLLRQKRNQWRNSPRVSPFANLQKLAALLQEINFSLPVADIDRHQVNYDHPKDLLMDLKKLGETNCLLKMNKSILRRDILNRMYEIYIDNFSKNRKIIATFEIAWLTGWKYHESQQKPLKRGSGN